MSSTLPLITTSNDIAQLASQSLWLSRHEMDLLLAKTDGFPPYLKELACGALQAEAQYRQQLAEEDPELLQYLIDLQAWFARDDRTAANFPGWRGCWEEQASTAESLAPTTTQETHMLELENMDDSEVDNPALKLGAAPNQLDDSGEDNTTTPHDLPPAPPSPPADTALTPWRPSAWQLPVDSTLLNLLSIHPLSEFDEANFLQLLSGSFSLSVAQKKRVIDAVPTLSQFQIDELTKVFFEERLEFSKQLVKEEDIIRALDNRCIEGISALKTMYASEGSLSGVIDDISLDGDSKNENDGTSHHLSSLIPQAPESEATSKTWCPSAWQIPVDSTLLDLLSVHPLSEFNETNFLRLLSGSFSLSITEKKRIIDAIPTLSQFQIDELINVFVEEREEFTKLLAKQEDIIRNLDDKCIKEVAVLKTMYSLEACASDVIDDEFLTSYLTIETMLLRFDFEQADSLAHTSFDACQFFSYEQCLKTRKALGQMDNPYLHSLIQHAVNSQALGLVDAVRVLIEIEQTTSDGIEQLWQRLQAFTLDGDMAWVPYYLRSRFHALMDSAENAFDMAQDQISLAFSMLPAEKIANKGPVLLQFKRCLLLKGGEDTFAFMQTGFGSLGSYLSEIGWLLGTHTQGKKLVDVENDLLEFLHSHLKQKALDLDLPLANHTHPPTSDQSMQLPKHLTAITQAISELGMDWQAPAQYKEIYIALADNNLVEAVRLLSEANAQSNLTIHQQILLWDMQVSLWRRQDTLADKIIHLQNTYMATPTAWQAWRLLIALYEVGAEGRISTLQLAQELALKFCYLPAFQNQLFATHHFLHTQNTHPPAAKQALWRAMAHGPTNGVFFSIANYFLWQKGGRPTEKTLAQGIAVLAGILVGTLSGKWGMAVLCAFQAGWHHLGWALFLLTGHQEGYDSNIYNDLAIGIAQAAGRNLDRTLLALAANTHALNRDPELNAVYISNSTADFKQLPATVAANWCLYRATLAIWHSPQRIWIQYGALLSAARQLARPDLYLPAFYVGSSLGAAIDLENENPHHILAPLFHNGRMILPKSQDSGYLSFLAWAIAQESKWLGEHHHVTAPWHWIYELLRKIEDLSVNITLPVFLAEEARRRQRELCLSPSWLLLRWPQKNQSERQQYRATELACLAQNFPQSNYQQRLSQDATDSQRRQLYDSLRGGRIAHSHQATINRVLPEWRKVVEHYLNAEFAELSQEKQVTALAERHRMELLRQLTPDHENTLEQIGANGEQQIMDVSRRGIASGENQSRFLGKGDYLLVEPQQKNLEQEYTRQAHIAYTLVLKHHALAGSDMFESFRTRIRHGWLISSLKDCFARFNLYNEGNNDTILTPSMELAMAKLAPQQRQGLEQVVAALRTEFRQLVEQLEKHWLWLKDEQHPEGLLDFDIKHFDTLPLFAHKALLSEAPEALIGQICQQIDQHANSLFTHIQRFLQQQLFVPLNQRLADISSWLDQARTAITALPNGAHEYARLFGEIEDARKEFAKQMEGYCAWFNFQEHGVRDFTLSEITRMAWQVVTQIDSTRLQTANINPPVWHDSLRPCWLRGSNFSDLLEACKVLLQNIVYHARPPNCNSTLPIDITLTLAQRADGRLSCRIASTCFAPEAIDCATLTNMLADPAQRQTRMQGKQGSGLASTQEVLQHRLHGIQGELLGPRLETTANGTSEFVVEMVLQVNTAGLKPEYKLSHQASPDIIQMLAEVAKKKVRVLIAEDQPPKFDALRDFICKLLPDCGVVLADDLETTARLLSNKESNFDLLLLDMTLPEDPLPDAPLKSLAGLDVLKLMQIHAIHTPTVMVTQYNNWGDEALQNTRQFIDDLRLACKRDFPEQFCGAVRFSHTDLAWQTELRALIQAIFNPTTQMPLDADSAEKRLVQDPNDRLALVWQAHQWLAEGKCREALANLLRLQRLDPNQAAVYGDLACAYAGLGQPTEAQQAFKTYQDLGGLETSSVHEQMLQGQMQWLKVEQQRLRQDEMMATLGQIAGGMAHELFSPMAAIQTEVDFARHLLKDAPKEDELHAALDEIERQKMRMAEIVTHLRSLARGDKISIDQVDLGQVLRAALALQQSQMDGHNILVKLEIPPHLPRVLANALVLEQVFINLLLNARDALDTSKTTEKTIHITIKPLAKNSHTVLQVSVSDNGPGVPEAIREKLFEPFFTTKDVGQGLGLGLSLARKGVSEYGGVIYLDNPGAGGASFVVELPVLEEQYHAT